MIALVEIYLERKVVAGIGLPLPISADDANVDAKLVLLENVVEIGLCIVFEYFIDVPNALKNDPALLDAHDGLIFLRSVDRGIGVKSDNKIFTDTSRFLKHKHVPCVAEIKSSYGDADFLSVSHIELEYHSKMRMLGLRKYYGFTKSAQSVYNVLMLALLASYKKDEDLLRLGKLLKENGWDIMGSAGTAQYLGEQGVECRDVGDVVGKPILGHRVVTLSREIYAALLAATDADFEELKKLKIEPIDLVYVTLYPLEETIASPESTPHDVIEKTDIGGPTLLRAAAKGRRITLSDASQIDDVEEWLKNGAKESARVELAEKLAAAAERKVADYVSASAAYWERTVSR